MNPRVLLLVSLIFAGAATRLAPHWWNLTAIGAICLFGGAYFRRLWVAMLVPLAAIALSDIPLTLFVYGPQGHGVNWFKYVCFALTVPGGNGPASVFVQGVFGDAAQPYGVALTNAVRIDFLP